MNIILATDKNTLLFLIKIAHKVVKQTTRAKIDIVCHLIHLSKNN